MVLVVVAVGDEVVEGGQVVGAEVLEDLVPEFQEFVEGGFGGEAVPVDDDGVGFGEGGRAP